MTTATTTTTTSSKPASPFAPLSALAGAEAELVRAIDAAAGSIDTIATGTVENALDRLAAAAEACKARLANHAGRLGAVCGGVLGDVEAFTTGVFEALSAEAWLDRTGTAHRQPAIESNATETVAPPIAVATPTAATSNGAWLELLVAAAADAPPAADPNESTFDLAAPPPALDDRADAARRGDDARRDMEEVSRAIAAERTRAIEVDPASSPAAVRAFAASFENITPDVDETVTTKGAVLRGMLTQVEADAVASQAEKFALAAASSTPDTVVSAAANAPDVAASTPAEVACSETAAAPSTAAAKRPAGRKRRA